MSRYAPYLSHCCRIITKSGSVIPLVPNWAQREFLGKLEDLQDRGRPARFIVLKARQLGFSTLTEALMFVHSFTYRHHRGLVVAHEQDAYEGLLQMTTNYWDFYPFKALYSTKFASRNELRWVETGSSIKTATARNVNAGRSQTVRFLHASEVAFWLNPQETMLSLRQTIPYAPGTVIVMESTANGVGNFFYDEWQAAVDGESDYVPIFAPWHRHPEYTAEKLGLPAALPGKLDSDERALKAIGATDSALVWRRWAIPNLCGGDINKFHQEYPSTPEEAFVSTGVNVFPIAKLRECYEPMAGEVGRLVRQSADVAFRPDIEGPLRIFKWPSDDRDWGQYYIGGDPTHSTRGDFAVAQVINRRTYEQCAILRLRCDPIGFAEELALLSRFYNDAWIATETEGPGYGTIGALIEKGVPNLYRKTGADKLPGKVNDSFGWTTTVQTKEWLVGWMMNLLVQNVLHFHDSKTFEELKNYVRLTAGGYGPADGTDHDDTVMALMIACLCSSQTLQPEIYTGNDGSPQLPWENWKAGMEMFRDGSIGEGDIE